MQAKLKGPLSNHFRGTTNPIKEIPIKAKEMNVMDVLCTVEKSQLSL